MRCCGKERGWGFWVMMAFLVPVGIAAFAFLFGSVVMLLWNALLPGIVGVTTITFWQALGILVLSKILFGGFSGGHSYHRPRHYSRHDWHGKWMHLNPEEREKMKSEWRSRCEPAAKQE